MTLEVFMAEDKQQAWIQEVSIRHVGDSIAAFSASGSFDFTVFDTSDFVETGGQVMVNGAIYTYVDADAEFGIISLTTALLADANIGDQVYVYPLAEEKWALAQLPASADSDSISARIPHYLADRFTEGIRSDTEQESAIVAVESGVWTVQDLVAKTPQLDTTSIGSDGSPPGDAVTGLTVKGSVGFSVLSWTPVLNNDLVTYIIYSGTTPGFTADGASEIGRTMGGIFVHRPVAPDYTITYYYKVRTSDVDGDGPLSAEVSTMLVQATNNDISAAYAYLGKVYFDQMLGGLMGAEMIVGGKITNRVDGAGAGIDLDQAGEVIYDALGQPQTILKPDESTFKGDAEFQNLTIKGAATIRALAEIARGAMVTMQSATTAPVGPPTAVQSYPDPVVETLFSGNYGLCWTGTDWATVGDSAPPLVQRNVSSDVALPADAPRPWGGLTRLGTDWYTLGFKGSPDAWYITRYNSSGVQQAQVVYTPVAGMWGSGGSPSGSLAPAGIGDDGTNILIGEFDDANNRYRIQVRDPSTLALSSTVNTGANSGFTGPVVSVQGGNFDFGAFRYVVLSRNGGHFYPFTSAGTYQPLDAWAVPVVGQMSGFDWDATRFWSTRAKSIATNAWVYKHTTLNWVGADPLLHFGRLTWRDTDAGGTGTHETDQGTETSFLLKKRAAITLTSPTIPDLGGTDDPDAVSFYLSKTGGVRTNYWRQTLPASGVNFILLKDDVTFAGTNPPATNNFPSATPGAIQSAAIAGDALPKSNLKGDGSGRLQQVVLGQVVRKAADESLTNNTTPQNDDHLFFEVEANGIYIVRTVLFVTSGASARGLKVGWSLPSGTFNQRGTGSGHPSPASSIATGEWGFLLGAISATQNFGIFATGGSVTLETLLLIGATGGTVTLQWAQADNVAANSTTVKAGSHLQAVKGT